MSIRIFIKQLFIGTVFLSINFLYIQSSPSAVTYLLDGGRLGDNLLSYCHAKWISYKHKIPLIYIPFSYSNCLMMHTLEKKYSPETRQTFKQVVSYRDVNGQLDPESGCLYVIPPFFDSIVEREDKLFPFLFEVDWEDPDFKKEIQRMIAPAFTLSFPPLPTDCITVALHVRKGTGFDIPHFQPNFDKLCEMFPLKCPPDSFYIEQIQRIVNMFHNQKIYIYLFTDHDKPADLIELYKATIDSDRVTFDCRKTDNNYRSNVLEDFFALTKFDCLIRGDSYFSFIASKLSNYKVLLSPWHFINNGGTIIIDEVNIEIRNT